ncbi:MAG: UDP-N-acetylmuramoyl-L-alanyl-D-glutamate--2,6-diaminopimelate ligase [Rikenellaceae bacterium]|nr:UDP-N-acetylmuramoyl-L-alanyl-D-glutamate--2,6-diaminopimelate ligase [Rikenellaceae bacterium]
MILKELLKGVTYSALSGSGEVEVAGLTYDSRTVSKGNCFFAVAGTAVDGHNFIAKAIEGGAVAVVCQHIPTEVADADCTFVVVEDTNVAMGVIASNFYGNPSYELKVVGVTGTNGKTTIATLLYDLVQSMGHKAGLISTVVYKVGAKEIVSTHTTPDAIRLNAMMREMVDEGCEYCFMECSSHAIVQHRIEGLRFVGGLFTNITHEHLDYHKTFAEYIRAKKSFFDALPKEAFALVNADDRNGEVMLQNTKASRYTLSLQRMADFRAKVVEMMAEGMELRIDNKEVWVQFLGRFNAYNLLTVYGAAVLLGFDKDVVLEHLSILRPVSGRFETVIAKDGTTAVVDFAHTPDALENIIKTIDELRQGGQRLIVVCGCGGDRDKTKRPIMGGMAAKMADIAIFTSDNPRTEDPEQILREMEAGVESGDKYLKITDRHEAIKTAVMLAEPRDIILLAGKGHEDYQIIGTEKHHFNDKEVVKEYFNQFNR